MSLSTILLLYEYRYFSQHNKQISALKREYEEMIMLQKKIVLKKAGFPHLENTINSVALLFPFNYESILYDSYQTCALDDEHVFLAPKLNSHSLIKKKVQRIKSRKTRIQKKFFNVSYHPNSCGYLQWPIDRSQFWMSSKFGPRKKANGSLGFHYGIDLAAVKGTPVKAAGMGTIIEATFSKRGYGKTIVIAHGSTKTRYAHLDEIYVKLGQKVNCGHTIGKVGNTGAVRGENGHDKATHLHFEVEEYGRHIDPLLALV